MRKVNKHERPMLTPFFSNNLRMNKSDKNESHDLQIHTCENETPEMVFVENTTKGISWRWLIPHSSAIPSQVPGKAKM